MRFFGLSPVLVLVLVLAVLVLVLVCVSMLAVVLVLVLTKGVKVRRNNTEGGSYVVRSPVSAGSIDP